MLRQVYTMQHLSGREDSQLQKSMVSFNFKQKVMAHLLFFLIQAFRLFQIKCNLCINSFVG